MGRVKKTNEEKIKFIENNIHVYLDGNGNFLHRKRSTRNWKKFDDAKLEKLYRKILNIVNKDKTSFNEENSIDEICENLSTFLRKHKEDKEFTLMIFKIKSVVNNISQERINEIKEELKILEHSI